MCSCKLSFSTLTVTKIAQMKGMKGPALQLRGANVHLPDGKCPIYKTRSASNFSSTLRKQLHQATNASHTEKNKNRKVVDDLELQNEGRRLLSCGVSQHTT